jgi:eukaryotic-like serine/threonine-protein kinase
MGTTLDRFGHPREKPLCGSPYRPPYTCALYLKTSTGTENESLLLEAANLPDDGRLPCDWSSDGRFIIYSQQDPGTGYDLWKLPLTGDHKPVALVRSQSNEYCGALSPGGRWIAYASDESGVVEIYVRPLPDEGLASGRPSQVSYNGGMWPKWSRDGKELFYLDREKYMVSVEVKIGAGFVAGTPQRLFPTGIHTPDARFDVTADRRRFIIPTEGNGVSTPATVLLNWMNGVRR